VLAVVLDSVATIHVQYKTFFYRFEIFSFAVFTLEYLARVWSATADPSGKFRHPLLGRLRYMVTPMAIMDLLAILPFFLRAFLGFDSRILRIFRLMRLLKLIRYSPALTIIGAVIVAQRKALVAALLIIVCALLFSATILFAVEHEAQPDKFSSIPAAMWWALATLSTVGYGDVLPITVWGRIFGAMTMILGIGMLALPTGVIASGFANEIRKRDFVVNWKLVSLVPLFKELDTAQIAEIVSLLTPLIVPSNHAVVKVGEEADSMFLLVSGKLEVEVHPQPFLVQDGEFFGEFSLLAKRKQVATTVSLTECQLLELKADDFERLLASHESMRDAPDEVLKIRRKFYEGSTPSEQV
jgi:voltage-gated potassium channel